MDTFSKSDPYVEITFRNADNEFGPQAVTQVVWNDNSAVFDTKLDFAYVKPEISTALIDQMGQIFGEEVDIDAFKPPEVAWNDEEDDKLFARFLGGTRRFKLFSKKDRRSSVR